MAVVGEKVRPMRATTEKVASGAGIVNGPERLLEAAIHMLRGSECATWWCAEQARGSRIVRHRGLQWA